ncbi:MAG: EMC3/TMCO1 family protein [Candidatus Bathyarchaeota archaeon]|jgi:uncharacterized membrane protein (DUF106 family)|nr:DUF106 domain-containing protein [Candidatus Bathyarchaeota archaeon A05DMB-5]MDH7557655.1 EMC3/TMCO1 family protein [Candidatus Bathyarchaeota archaeon]
MNFIEWLLMPEAPGATIIIMFVCVTISLLSSSVNRLLIAKLVGWEQYRMMQKEIAEHRALSTQAFRTKDKKLLEKLKKKESEILSMQKKMARPQLILFLLSFSYIFIWLFVLGPAYAGNAIAIIPGIGKIDLFWWYFICSFAFGTIFSRVLGIMPIE